MNRCYHSKKVNFPWRCRKMKQNNILVKLIHHPFKPRSQSFKTKGKTDCREDWTFELPSFSEEQIGTARTDWAKKWTLNSLSRQSQIGINIALGVQDQISKNIGTQEDMNVLWPILLNSINWYWNEKKNLFLHMHLY